MIDELSFVETDKVIHTMEMNKVKQIVDVESSGKSAGADEIDKETVSFGEMQLKQEDRSCVHASTELHLHAVHVFPRIKDYCNEKIDIRFRRECENMIDELKGKFNGMNIEINKKKELQQLDQAAKLSTYTTEPSRRFNYFYDDDDEESSIPLRKIISELPSSIAITPVSSTIEPEDSLIMRNEELSTIPEKESDEFIKSSVEDLVPIPSESEDTSESDSDCDLPSCDNISPINVFEEKSMTFSNPLFYSNDDFTFSDDESLSDEDVPDVNPRFDEVLEDIECKDSYDSNLDESTFLVTHLSDSNEDECFTPSDDVELLLHRDSSTPMISVVSILEGFTDEPPLEENDDLFDLESKGNEWKKIMYDAPIDDLMTEDKDCPDFEGSRARGFVHRSLDLQSFTCLYMGIRYPRSY
ncbi:hypothetical protein Tco_1509007 [Tanacetum coccineum]